MNHTRTGPHHMLCARLVRSRFIVRQVPEPAASSETRSPVSLSAVHPTSFFLPMLPYLKTPAVRPSICECLCRSLYRRRFDPCFSGTQGGREGCPMGRKRAHSCKTWQRAFSSPKCCGEAVPFAIRHVNIVSARCWMRLG